MPSVTDKTPEDVAALPAPASVALLPGLYNPLQHLVAAAELLDRQRLTPEARACARAILQSGRMLLNVMEDLRHLAALDDPREPATPTLVTELVEEVEGLWRLQTAPSAGRLLLSCNAPAGLALQVDAGSVKQLLNTLIGRALGGSTDGVVEAAVSIDASDAQGLTTLNLVVRQSVASRVASTQDSAHALAEALAMRLGGALRLTTNPGAGETMAVSLPVEIAEACNEGEIDDTPVLPSRTHVLIVDDNATNRMVAGALCEMFGCTTQTAEDGVEAVEAARAGRFDLILMDIKMPRMDGIEATRAIRRLPGALGRTPVVALTANSDAEAAKVYMASGMNAVVEKPIKPDRLLETMQLVLEHDTAVAEDEPLRRSSVA